VKLRSEGLTWQEIDGELVILDLNNSVYLTTNAAGAVIAKLLTEERTVDELSGALVAEFGIENDVARHDTEAFVKQLKDKRLLD
jgi:Coenzyme PQQ synthesis protein D (PqqD)